MIKIQNMIMKALPVPATERVTVLYCYDNRVQWQLPYCTIMITCTVAVSVLHYNDNLYSGSYRIAL